MSGGLLAARGSLVPASMLSPSSARIFSHLAMMWRNPCGSSCICRVASHAFLKLNSDVVPPEALGMGTGDARSSLVGSERTMPKSSEIGRLGRAETVNVSVAACETCHWA